MEHIASPPPGSGHGRPGRPRTGHALLKPITVRLAPAMNAEIERQIKTRIDGADKSQIIRELIAKGLASEPSN